MYIKVYLTSVTIIFYDKDFFASVKGEIHLLILVVSLESNEKLVTALSIKFFVKH